MNFDWNNNDHHDFFDSFMDMKVMDDVNKKASASALNSNDDNDGDDKGNVLAFGKFVIYDPSKDSDGVVAAKSLTVAVLCLAGIFLPAFLGLDGIAVPLCILAGVVSSLAILKFT